MRIADRVLLGDVKLPPGAMDRAGNVKWNADSISASRGESPDFSSLSADELRDRLAVKESELKAATRELNAAQRNRRDIEARIQSILAEAITQSTVVRADNVYRYLYDMVRALDPYDIPSFAPALQDVSMEWAQNNGNGILVAGSCTAGSFLPDVAIDGEASDHGYRPTENALWWSNNLPDVGAWKSVRWLWRLSVFVALPGESVYGPMARIQIAVAETGRALDITRDYFIPNVDASAVEPNGQMSRGVLEILTHSVVSVFGYAMTFLGCRNVATVWYDPPAGLQRKHRRKRGAEHPLVRYHVIEVRPVAGERARSRKGTDDGDLRALHPVRGHFSHYGNCCPGSHPPHGKLFGKYEGRVFMPPHARGNREAGVVAAEYNVHAPTGQEGTNG